MSKHTPGPWYLGEYDSSYSKEITIESESTVIAFVDYDDVDRETAEKDAILMVAAPEMLEHLIWIECAMNVMEDMFAEEPSELRDYIRGIGEKIHVAIDKAEGK